MAQNEMKAMRGMPLRVRSTEGLGGIVLKRKQPCEDAEDTKLNGIGRAVNSCGDGSSVAPKSLSSAPLAAPNPLTELP
jgi:hypothetical protein